MTRKKGEKKLGRNPFDERVKPKVKARESGKAAPADIPPAQPVIIPDSTPPPHQGGDPGGMSTPATPAWFLVDLWAGALMEPYFFWARSMDIMKRTMESATRSVVLK